MDDELKLLLEEHRKNSVTSCDETCFCWVVESYLAKMEKLQDELSQQDLDDMDEQLKHSAWCNLNLDCNCGVGEQK